jgi:DNA-directed RNA polymerase specialized sigma24 family protein
VCGVKALEGCHPGGQAMRHTREDDLADWLASGYARAYRTAYLLVRDARDAEEAVQEAYLRVWRFRASLPDGARAASRGSTACS